MDNAASGVDAPEGGTLVVKAMGVHGDGTQAVDMLAITFLTKVFVKRLSIGCCSKVRSN